MNVIARIYDIIFIIDIFGVILTIKNTNQVLWETFEVLGDIEKVFSGWKIYVWGDNV